LGSGAGERRLICRVLIIDGAEENNERLLIDMSAAIAGSYRQSQFYLFVY
jgi:hypothetical protein